MKNTASIKLVDFESLISDREMDTFGHNVQKCQVTEKNLPITCLHNFVNHPFPVEEDDELKSLAESIKEHGVIHSVIVRPREKGGYEIISGHRRTMAAKEAGMDMVPCKIVEMDDDEATACMVEANFRSRENIKTSVKAKAYRMEHDALKHQGKNTGVWSLERMGEAAGESGKTVQRYVRLSYLTDELLEYVDKKKLGLAQGVEISYLTEEAQYLVWQALEETKVKMTLDQAVKIKEMGQKDFLFYEMVASVLLDTGKKKKVSGRLNEKKIRSYFPKDYSDTEIEQVLIGLLEKWKAGETDG